MIKDRLARPGADPAADRRRNDFAGVVDLIKMKAIVWERRVLGAEFEYHRHSAELPGKGEEWREKMIEAGVEPATTLMEAYLEGNGA